MLPVSDGPLTVRSAWSRGTRPGILPAPAALFLLKDRRAAWPARLVAAVACSPRMTGATGRCLLHIPSGIRAVRESRVQPPVDRSRQAG
jgi:hypothetical protein